MLGTIIARNRCRQAARERGGGTLSARGPETEPLVLEQVGRRRRQGARERGGSSLSARRPEPDPLVLDLVEMYPRVIFGDRKSEGRDVEAPNRGQQLVRKDNLVVLGRNQRRSRLQQRLLGVEHVE